jgi:DNA-directed RNA polymerase subunit RPC12/RpoP
MSEISSAVIPADVLKNLKMHAAHRDNVTCLECGYKGMMGIKSAGTRPVLALCAALGLVVVFATFGLYGITISSAIFGASAMLFWKGTAKPTLSCPNCGKDLLLK